MKLLSSFMVCGLVLCFALSGCGAKKAESSSSAIEQSQAMQTVKQKVDFLVGQANAFYNSKQFQDAISIAQYILTNLDRDSQAAKNLIEKAKEQITKQAQSMLDEAKKGVAGFGK